MRGYQQLLYRSAFGNFRQLLYDVTLNPTMGRFLDMLNNRCQTRTPPDVSICRNGLNSQPNENYAREILQLFSIGTFLLNQTVLDNWMATVIPFPAMIRRLSKSLPGYSRVGFSLRHCRVPRASVGLCRTIETPCACG